MATACTLENCEDHGLVVHSCNIKVLLKIAYLEAIRHLLRSVEHSTSCIIFATVTSKQHNAYEYQIAIVLYASIITTVHCKFVARAWGVHISFLTGTILLHLFWRQCPTWYSSTVDERIGMLLPWKFQDWLMRVGKSEIREREREGEREREKMKEWEAETETREEEGQSYQNPSSQGRGGKYSAERNLADFFWVEIRRTPPSRKPNY